MEYRVEYYLPRGKSNGKIQGWMFVRKRTHSWFNAIEIATRAAIKYGGPIKIWAAGEVIWKTTNN